MQFQVPQFIETEDKIVGPFTLRQFLYIAFAGVISFILFFSLALWLWFILTFILAGISASLAFIKINGRPLIVIVQAAFKYTWSPKIYALKPLPPQTAPQIRATAEKKQLPVLGGIKGLLEKMATSKEAVPKRERTIAPGNFGIPQREIRERYEVIKRITGEREVARRIDYR